MLFLYEFFQKMRKKYFLTPFIKPALPYNKTNKYTKNCEKKAKQKSTSNILCIIDINGNVFNKILAN